MARKWIRILAFTGVVLAVSIAALLQASPAADAKGSGLVPERPVTLVNQGLAQVPGEDEEDGEEDGEPDEEDGPAASPSGPVAGPSSQSGGSQSGTQAARPAGQSQTQGAQQAVACPDMPAPAPARPSGPITIEVTATGAEEVPVVTGPGSAFARFVFDEASGKLTYFATVFGLSPNIVTAAHIHRGAAGVNGPIVHFISATGFTQASGEISLSAADIADLKAGNFYFNVHSVDNPGGFARAQLVLPPAPAAAVALIECIVAPTRPISPPRTGDGGLLEASTESQVVVQALFLALLAGFAAYTLGHKRA